jgi:hypothetical protein
VVDKVEVEKYLHQEVQEDLEVAELIQEDLKELVINLQYHPLKEKTVEMAHLSVAEVAVELVMVDLMDLELMEEPEE